MGGGNQANVEYFFRLIYNLFHGGATASVNYTAIEAWAAHVWIWIVYIGYVLSAAGFVFIVYAMVRLFELREREEHKYGTLILAPEEMTRSNVRWEHIQELAQADSPSQWREAIIEADIMLHDILTNQGYQGEGVAEKLRTIDTADLGTLQHAWDAHRVRNQIAHEGSAFNLSKQLAQRTIQQYESVFREFGVI